MVNLHVRSDARYTTRYGWLAKRVGREPATAAGGPAAGPRVRDPTGASTAAPPRAVPTRQALRACGRSRPRDTPTHPSQATARPGAPGGRRIVWIRVAAGQAAAAGAPRQPRLGASAGRRAWARRACLLSDWTRGVVTATDLDQLRDQLRARSARSDGTRLRDRDRLRALKPPARKPRPPSEARCLAVRHGPQAEAGSGRGRRPGDAEGHGR